MAVVTVGKNNFDEEVMKSDKTVLIDFWASWCGPCQMLSPVVDEVAKEMNDIKVCKINIDEEPEISRDYRVMSIPMLIVIKNGEVTNKSVGVIGKSDIINLL